MPLTCIDLAQDSTSRIELIRAILTTWQARRRSGAGRLSRTSGRSPIETVGRWGYGPAMTYGKHPPDCLMARYVALPSDAREYFPYAFRGRPDLCTCGLNHDSQALQPEYATDRQGFERELEGLERAAKLPPLGGRTTREVAESPAPPRPSSYTAAPYLWQDGPQSALTGDDDDYSGKWLVFVPIDQVDYWWDVLRAEVERGQLGPSAKVATAAPNPLTRSPVERVICVYTQDFRDHDDVRRVLAGLRRVGVTWQLSYKTDRDTIDGKYGHRSASYVSRSESHNFEDRTADRGDRRT